MVCDHIRYCYFVLLIEPSFFSNGRIRPHSQFLLKTEADTA